ncbi:hypothetical protein EZV62_025561 [Acer yangbiense]|uniref:Uncharacterized protein n=1 Tax=Acer yangbiense TaxID=1000413 RepID=A0A5C7H082_9ROSI|nr:hypothetical protein EZV62_025561 [Acer yangbiense]
MVMMMVEEMEDLEDFDGRGDCRFCVKEPDDLEGRVVELSVDEGLQLLKASMESKTVLASVFLGNTGA